jgi:hypothetical protein
MIGPRRGDRVHIQRVKKNSSTQQGILGVCMRIVRILRSGFERFESLLLTAS